MPMHVSKWELRDTQMFCDNHRSAILFVHSWLQPYSGGGGASSNIRQLFLLLLCC